jgi:hypothetical protein
MANPTKHGMPLDKKAWSDQDRQNFKALDAVL